jgi:predicted metal-dependent phosphoesterase TrpH
MRIDLHTHSTASDGVLQPSDLVVLAGRRGVDVIALTDHDTVSGVEEARATGAAVGVRVVAGIELSARHENRTLHVLGYFVDTAAEALSRTLEEMHAERRQRAESMISKLSDLGFELTLEDVLAQTKGAVVARPHIARALVARGYVRSVRDAFTADLIADGGRADVPRRRLAPIEAVALLRQAGGVAVLAHPGVAHHDGSGESIDESLILELAQSGLSGLEVDHPDHEPPIRERLRALAAAADLIPTGGSDFHGESDRPIALCMTADEDFARLESLSASR